MTYKKSIIINIVLAVWAFNCLAQQSSQQYEIKKGEVIDILLFTTKEDAGVHFDNYKKTAFPYAIKQSYQPLPGYGISRTIFGNIQPQTLVFGKWSSLKHRKDFLAGVDDNIPGFHEMRQDIWSSFYLTYYEASKDLTFDINKDNYLVATAYWGDHVKEVKSYINKQEQVMAKKGGTTIIRLEDGISPFRYHFSPEVFLLTAWESKEDFEQYQKTFGTFDEVILTNVQQFELQ